MERTDFRNNLVNAIKEFEIYKIENLKFKIITVFEEGKRYNSNDEYMKLGALDRADLGNKYFDLDGAINLLSAPNSRFPLWITIELIEKKDCEYFFQLRTSLRFRTPSVLQNQETGHPPFKVIKNEYNK